MSPKPGNQPLVYDENLLAQAPEVTQGQRQEGYDADILNPSLPPASRSQPYHDRPDVESGSSGHDKHLAAGGYNPVGQPAKKPFWKTPKGIIILSVLALAVIAAVVGGAVGGTVGKNKNNNGENIGGGAAGGSGNNTVTSTGLPSSTTVAPGETGGGGDTPGGGGSNQTSSTRRDGTSPTPTTTSDALLSTTTATMTSQNVDPPAQPVAGNGAGTVK